MLDDFLNTVVFVSHLVPVSQLCQSKGYSPWANLNCVHPTKHKTQPSPGLLEVLIQTENTRLS